jgi:hypothetical protein
LSGTISLRFLMLSLKSKSWSLKRLFRLQSISLELRKEIFLNRTIVITNTIQAIYRISLRLTLLIRLRTEKLFIRLFKMIKSILRFSSLDRSKILNQESLRESLGIKTKPSQSLNLSTKMSKSKSQDN